MKRILVSLLTIVAVSAVGVAATRAYFSDQATSPDNTFTAGTLDLVLDNEASFGISLTNMAPGDSSGEQCITVRNVGTLPGWLGINSSYTESDGSTGSTNVSAENFAKALRITSFKADGVEIVSMIPNVDGDGVASVFDIVNDSSAVTPPHRTDTWHSYDTNMASSEVHTYCATVQLDSAAGNDYQGDGIKWNFSFFLGQI